MNRIALPQVTLVAIASTEVDATITALMRSMRGISYAEVLLITHENRNLSSFGITVIPVERLDYKGYNHFVAYRLADYIKSDFALIVQNDGYVRNPAKWDPSFLAYDYIGAPWQANIHFTPQGTNVRVGNGGFSLRSKRLLTILNELALPFADFGTSFFHEDGLICVHYRHELEAAGITFAPVSIASNFSREKWCHDSVLFPFGFHSNRHNILLYIKKKIAKYFHIHL